MKNYFNLVQEKDGIYYCSQQGEVESKFSDAVQDDIFEIEDTSWWFQYRARVIREIAQKFFDKEKLIFDVGGGNGYTTRHMQIAGWYMMALLEPAPAACINAKKRGVQAVICGTLTEETVEDGSMEQILLLDVLEHIEYDAQFLKTMYSKLEPGGAVLLGLV